VVNGERHELEIGPTTQAKNLAVWWGQGFFLNLIFYQRAPKYPVTAKSQKYRLFTKQILNLFFYSKTNTLCIHIIIYFWLSSVVRTSRSQSIVRGIELWEMHRSSFSPFLTKHVATTPNYFIYRTYYAKHI
jgi:hypothetical protein